MVNVGTWILYGIVSKDWCKETYCCRLFGRVRILLCPYLYRWVKVPPFDLAWKERWLLWHGLTGGAWPFEMLGLMYTPLPFKPGNRSHDIINPLKSWLNQIVEVSLFSFPCSMNLGGVHIIFTLRMLPCLYMRLVELKDVRLRNEGLGRYLLEDMILDLLPIQQQSPPELLHV